MRGLTQAKPWFALLFTVAAYSPLSSADPYGAGGEIICPASQTCTSTVTGSTSLYENVGTTLPSDHLLPFTPATTVTAEYHFDVFADGKFSLVRTSQPLGIDFQIGYTVKDSAGKSTQLKLMLPQFNQLVDTAPFLAPTNIRIHTNGASTTDDKGNANLHSLASDPQNNQLSFSSGGSPSHGTFVVAADGTFRYQHTGGVSSLSDTVLINVCETSGGSLCKLASIPVSVDATHPPRVVNDALQVLKGGATTATVTGSNTLLSNDTDVDGQQGLNLKAGRGQLGGARANGHIDFATEKGKATVNQDGTFSYSNAVPVLFPTVQANPGTFFWGSGSSYVVTVANRGGVATSGNTAVTYTLPAGFSPGVTSGSGWQCFTGSPLICLYAASIPSGGVTPALSLNAGNIAATPGPNAGDFSITAIGGGDTTCPSQLHCVAMTSAALKNSAAPVLSGTVVSVPASFSAGQLSSYQLVVKNTGQASTTSAFGLSARLAPGVTYAGAIGASCSAAQAPQISCASVGPNLAPNGTAAVTLFVTTSPSTTGPHGADLSVTLSQGGDDTCPNASHCRVSAVVGVNGPSGTGAADDTDSFQYYTCDSDAVCRLGTVTASLLPGAQPNNKLPVPGDDAIQVASGGTASILVGGANSVLANDLDPDSSDVLSARWVSDPDYGTVQVNIDGTFVYTNTVPGASSSDQFQYQACDQHGACRMSTVTIAIGAAAPDHQPIVIDDAIQAVKNTTTTALVGGVSGGSLLDNDADADSSSGDVLKAVLLTQPAGQLTLNTNGTFSYTAPGSAMADGFYYEACDKWQSCSVGKVTITVTDTPQPSNHKPWVVDDAIQASPGGPAVSILTGGATTLQANDIDIDGDTLTAVARSRPTSGTLVSNPDGTFSYKPPISAVNDSFVYQSCDSRGACAAGKVTIWVSNSPSNHPPLAIDDAIQVVPAGSSVTALIGGASSVAANDLDADGDALTTTLISSPLPPSSGAFTLNANGTFVFTPPASAATDRAAYEVCDAHGACAAAFVKLNVTNAPPDSAPLPGNDVILVKPGSGPVQILADGHLSVLDNDFDADGDSLTATLKQPLAQPGQSLTFDSAGTFSYTPPATELTDSFQYQACDTFGACNIATVLLTVTNTLPVLSVDEQALPGTFVVDKPASYVLTVSNTGTSSTGASIALSDVLPTGITLDTVTGVGWSCLGSSSLSCTYSGTLAPGASTTLTLNVLVGGAATTANNSAKVSGGGDATCPLAAHCTAAVVAAVSAVDVPVLVVSKDTQPGTFVVNKPASYVFTVVNSGGAATSAANIVLTDVLPVGITLSSVDGSNWNCAGTTTLTCTFNGGALAPGASSTLTVNVAVSNLATTASNTAVVSGGGDSTCPNATHCQGSVVAAVSPVDVPILALSELAAPGTFVLGKSASYQLTVKNTGAVATSGAITLADNLPSGITLNSAAGVNWNCAGLTSLSCTFKSNLPPSASTTLVLNVLVSGSAKTGSNSAVVSGGNDNSCPTASHCKAGVNVSVSASDVPVLTLAKQAVPGTFVVGEPASYLFTLTNAGAAATDGTNLTLTDILPNGITLSGTHGAGWNCGGPGNSNITCSYNGGVLAAGASTTLALDVNVSSLAATANNSAKISGGGDASCPNATHCQGAVLAAVSATDVPVLTVAKLANPGTFVVNKPASYVLTVRNSGSAATSGAISLTDVLPAGITLSKAAGVNWSCVGSASLSCTYSGVLAPNAATSLTLNVSVSSFATSASNTAVLSGGGDASCPAASHCQGSTIAAVTVADVPVLALTKRALPGTFVAGKPASYLLTVSNAGAAATDGSNLVLTDLLPADISLNSASGANWNCVGTSNVSCTFSGGSLAPGASTSLSLDVSVLPTATSADNAAAVSGGGDATCPGASHCRANVVAAVSSADVPVLTVTKQATPGTFVFNKAASYTITVTNTGAAPSLGPALAVVDTLPGGISMSSFSGANWNCQGSTVVTCAYSGVLAAGDSSTVTLNVAVSSAATSASNIATISSGDATCPLATHCQGEVVAAVSATDVPILSVSKVATPATFTINQPASYVLKVINTGRAPTSGANLALTDSLPNGITLKGATGANWVCAGVSSINCTYSGGALAPGAAASLVMNVAVSGLAITANNTATASGGGDSSCPGASHCQGSVVAAVSAMDTPILTITKQAVPGNFVAGKAAGYVIKVTNKGNTPTTADISLLDDLPSGISLNSAAGTDWSCLGTSTLSCAYGGRLAPGASTTLSLDVGVSASATTASNTAKVSGGGDASCPAASHCLGKVVAGITDLANSQSLTITKVAKPSWFTVGQPASYEITVANDGYAASAPSIVLTDPLPPGISYVSAMGANWICSGSTTVTCNYSGALAGSQSIGGQHSTTVTLNVAVSGSAIGPNGADNTAFVSGGGDPFCPGASHCQGSVEAGVSLIAITTSDPLPSAVQGNVYSPVTFAATGGNGAYSWSLINPALAPPGLALSSAGVMTGTPTASGSFDFEVKVVDSASQVGIKAFHMDVAPATGLLITTPSPLIAATAGTAYTATSFAASGGVHPYTWSLANGTTLPPGLTLSVGGEVTGTPTTSSATPFFFDVQATDSLGAIATKSFEISVTDAGVITITTVDPLISATHTVPYSATTFTASGGQPTSYSWSTANGSQLPPGLTLAANGALTGAPTFPGPNTFFVKVQDASGASATKQFHLYVTEADVVTITTADPLQTAMIGTNYDGPAFSASGGTAPYTWSLTTGSTLPPGMNLAQGALTGAPTAQGSYTFGIRATDAVAASDTKTFHLVVRPTGLAISTPPGLAPGTVGSSYPSITLGATGGKAPYLWSMANGKVLPDGLTLSGGGLLSGKPNIAGNFQFDIQVADRNGVTAAKTFTLTVSPATVLSITTAGQLPAGTAGTSYGPITFAAAGGSSPYTWNLAGGSSLPSGLSLTRDGILGGMLGAGLGGSYSFNVTVTDNAGTSVTNQFTLSIAAAGSLSISTAGPVLPPAQVGAAYSALSFTAVGGTAPYSWSLINGTVAPDGMSFSSAGVLSGTPNLEGSYGLDVQVADSAGITVAKSFVLSVSPAAVVRLSPIAANDALVVNAGGTATTVNGGENSVLSNDLNPNNGSLGSQMIASVQAPPSKGTLTLQPATGTLAYHDTSNSTTATTDSFQYLACDAVDTAKCSVGTVSIQILPAGAPLPVPKLPLIVNDAAIVNPGQSASQLSDGSSNVLANDSDPNANGTLSATLVAASGPVNGTLEFPRVGQPNGTFRYTNSSGSGDSFVYQACDSVFAACALGKVTITVVPVGTPSPLLPLAVDDQIQVAPNATATLLVGNLTSVLDNDADPNTPSKDNSTLDASLVGGGPLHGTLQFTPGGKPNGGTFTYQNTGGAAFPTDGFAYQACDTLFGTCSMATVSIAVTTAAANRPPQAAADAMSVSKGGVVTKLTTPNGGSSVLENDVDPDTGETATLKAFLLGSGPQHGTLALNNDGTFSYQHNNDTATSDSFEYEACDVHGACASATVAITIGSSGSASPTIACTLPTQVYLAGGVAAADGTTPIVSVDLSKLFVPPASNTLTYSATGLPMPPLAINGAVVAGTFGTGNAGVMTAALKATAVPAATSATQTVKWVVLSQADHLYRAGFDGNNKPCQ